MDRGRNSNRNPAVVISACLYRNCGCRTGDGNMGKRLIEGKYKLFEYTQEQIEEMKQVDIRTVSRDELRDI